MLRNNIKILLLGFVILLLNGCKSSYAPSNWLPGESDSRSLNYGGWLHVELVQFSMLSFLTPDSSFKNISGVTELDGEFIAFSNFKVYLLGEKGSLFCIPAEMINYSCLEISDKNPGIIVVLGLLGTLSSIGNGLLSLLTGPMWLITTIVASASESVRDTYRESYPGLIYWNEVNKFSRFPQGLPEGIDLKKLKTKKYI